jgi:hypothetical protein
MSSERPKKQANQANALERLRALVRLLGKLAAGKEPRSDRVVNQGNTSGETRNDD